MAPRAPGDSVRPRRLTGVVGRPLNFTVRRHVRSAFVHPRMTGHRWSLWLPLLVGVMCLISLLTLFAYPDWDTPAAEARPLGWWQFRVFAWVGLVLVWLPSGVVFLLDAFFHQHEALRNPFVLLLIAIELALTCYGAHRVGRRVQHGA